MNRIKTERTAAMPAKAGMVIPATVAANWVGCSVGTIVVGSRPTY